MITDEKRVTRDLSCGIFDNLYSWVSENFDRYSVRVCKRENFYQVEVVVPNGADECVITRVFDCREVELAVCDMASYIADGVKRRIIDTGVAPEKARRLNGLPPNPK